MTGRADEWRHTGSIYSITVTVQVPIPAASRPIPTQLGFNDHGVKCLSRIGVGPLQRYGGVGLRTSIRRYAATRPQAVTEIAATPLQGLH